MSIELLPQPRKKQSEAVFHVIWYQMFLLPNAQWKRQMPKLIAFGDHQTNPFRIRGISKALSLFSFKQYPTILNHLKREKSKNLLFYIHRKHNQSYKNSSKMKKECERISKQEKSLTGMTLTAYFVILLSAILPWLAVCRKERIKNFEKVIQKWHRPQTWSILLEEITNETPSKKSNYWTDTGTQVIWKASSNIHQTRKNPAKSTPDLTHLP